MKPVTLESPKINKYLDKAMGKLEIAEENQKDIWQPEVAEKPKDDFQDDIKETAGKLLTAIKKTAGSRYELEASDLAKLTKAVCDLQVAFYGKDEKNNVVIMSNQLSMFKGMLK